jgi:uncharacterized membrane protein
MRPPFYVTQLKRDLDMWIAQGLVPAENRERILATIAVPTTRGRLESILAIFGAILIGAGALSFVGANWADMSKGARLVVLFGSMWLAYAAAIWALQANRKFIGEALLLLGVLLFGANIWFVAQTYNINSHYPDGSLLWALGALVTALLAPSRAALVAALAIGSLWTVQESTDFDGPLHVQFILFWSVCAAQAAFIQWRPGIHLSALSLILWFVVSNDSLQDLLLWSDAEIASIYVFLPLLVWSVTQIREPGPNGITLMVGHYAFFTFIAAFSVVHLFDGHTVGSSLSWIFFAAVASILTLGAVMLPLQRKGASAMDIAGTFFAIAATIYYVTQTRGEASDTEVPYLICSLVVILWSLSRGARLDDRFVINWSIVAFGGWVLYTYFELFSALMDQAVFFTVGGILLILLALGLEPLRRRLIASATA